MINTKLLPLPAIDAIVKYVEDYARANVAAKDAEIEALRAELAEARDGWHMANGVADLAMKHRDAAEARAERLEEALRDAREYVTSALQAQREAFAGYEDCSDIPGTEADLHKINTLLREQEERNG